MHQHLRAHGVWYYDLRNLGQYPSDKYMKNVKQNARQIVCIECRHIRTRLNVLVADAYETTMFIDKSVRRAHAPSTAALNVLNNVDLFPR